MFRIVLVLVVLLVAGLIAAWLVGNRGFRARMADAEAAWKAIAERADAPGPVFDPQDLADQPEVARRYLVHAIAPGTRLSRHVRLTMDGTFRLGNATDPKPLVMQARQMLEAPGAFVWIARMRGGGMVIDGSDGFENGHGWTRFWAFRSVPLVRAGPSQDLDRSALARPALEAVWAPAALHPAFGARWVQTGPDSADVTFGEGPRKVVIGLTLSPDGAVRRLVTQRWSDANPDKTYRLQPFGGEVTGEARFGGYTIPSRIAVGNQFGTADYFAFFEVRITGADYLPAQP